jgi:hypothetical protein
LFVLHFQCNNECFSSTAKFIHFSNWNNS